jgi:hypothetical protein
MNDPVMIAVGLSRPEPVTGHSVIAVRRENPTATPLKIPAGGWKIEHQVAG